MQIVGQEALQRRVNAARVGDGLVEQLIRAVITTQVERPPEGIEKGQVRRLGTVALAAAFDHSDVVALQAVAKLEQQAALARACISDHCDKLAVSGICPLRAGEQACQLTSSAGVAGQASALRRFEARFGFGRPENPVRRERVRFAFQPRRCQSLGLEVICDPLVRLGADEHLVGCCLSGNPCPRVNRIARDSVGAVTLITQVGHHEASVDTGVQPKRLADARFDRRRHVLNHPMQRKRGADSTYRIVFVCNRDAEQSEDLVTHELVDDSSMRLDDTHSVRLDVPDQLGHHLRVEPLVHRSVAGQVGEQHRGLTAFALGRGSRSRAKR